jgi:hypothetical protein
VSSAAQTRRSDSRLSDFSLIPPYDSGRALSLPSRASYGACTGINGTRDEEPGIGLPAGRCP